jgi:hypothetical protein
LHSAEQLAKAIANANADAAADVGVDDDVIDVRLAKKPRSTAGQFEFTLYRLFLTRKQLGTAH